MSGQQDMDSVASQASPASPSPTADRSREITAPRRAMGSHHSARAQSVVWLTPPHVLAALGAFDLDPCACCEPRPWPTAAAHFTKADDGLAKPWTGRVWLNPPFGAEAGRWLRKLAAHGHGTALVMARTETRWWRDEIWRKADAILFLYTPRLHFHRGDGVRAAANCGAPCALIAYGNEDARRLQDCGLAGAYVPLTPADYTLASQSIGEVQRSGTTAHKAFRPQATVAGDGE